MQFGFNSRTWYSAFLISYHVTSILLVDRLRLEQEVKVLAGKFLVNKDYFFKPAFLFNKG